jgi:hypothetical protein
VLQGRFELGEKIIATHPESSYWYVRKIPNDSFSLFHSIILNSEFKIHYIDFLKSINYDLSEISEWLI